MVRKGKTNNGENKQEQRLNRIRSEKRKQCQSERKKGTVRVHMEIKQAGDKRKYGKRERKTEIGKINQDKVEKKKVREGRDKLG